MNTRLIVVAGLVGMMALVGCKGAGGSKAANADASWSPGVDRLSSLPGRWEMTAPDGTKSDVVFKRTSAGTAVCEVMFPGDDHEMTNMYHADGDTVIMTHYCAMGNQPRMRAKLPAAGQWPMVFEFKADSVTNLSKPDETYMGSMTLTIVDKDTIKEDWMSMKSGKVTPDHHPVFILKRKG